MSSQSHSIDSSASERDRPRSWWSATLLLVVGALTTYVAQAIAWLVLSFVLDVPEGTDSAAVFISLWVGAVALPLVLLWFAGGRRRWFSAGGVAVMVLLVVATLATANEPLRDPAVQERLEATAQKSPVPLYYPGPTFHGWTLDDEGIDHGGSVDTSDTELGTNESLFLGYGTTCTQSTIGTCGVRYEIDLHRFRPDDTDARCLHRLPTTRGVTPVELDRSGVTIFVGDVVITFPDQPDDALVTATARALRPVGKARSNADLPAPPASVATLISHCLARPRG